MQRFAKVLSRVSKKGESDPVENRRILLGIDSRVFKRVSLPWNSRRAGQGSIVGVERQHGVTVRAIGVEGRLQPQSANVAFRNSPGVRERLSSIPGLAGLADWPGVRSPVELFPITIRPCWGNDRRKTKLGFVNLWWVNSLKGISAKAANWPSRLAFSS